MSILAKGKAATMEGEKCHLVLKNAKYINVFTEEFSYGDIGIIDNIIVGIGSYHGINEIDCSHKVISPGFIDCHVHIESSMVTPRTYGELVLKNGVTTIIADPHEIANVLGNEGINYMLGESKKTPLDIYFMIPSCVPATKYEENGSKLEAEDLKSYLDYPKVLGLGEVMDVPAVINMDESIIEKLHLFKDKNIDGHCPHISGPTLNQYILSGIKTDHESSTVLEALEKIQLGMYILVREGSAAKNLKALVKGITEKNFRRFAFCSDDRHIEDMIEEGTINNSIKYAISLGVDPIHAYIMATKNGCDCYNLNNKGAIAPGYNADLVILDDFEQVKINCTIKNGLVFKENPLTEKIDPIKNSMNLSKVTVEDFNVKIDGNKINIIEVIPNSLETKHLILDIKDNKNLEIAFGYEDLLKVSVLERHRCTNHRGIGFLKGLGFKNCSMAQSIAHDSHNIIVVGDRDEDMAIAVNKLRDIGGGIVIVSDGHVLDFLPLELGGIMTEAPLHEVCEKIKSLNKIIKSYGLKDGIDPFITLSFMSLPVIPNIKLTTKGLFSYESFNFIPLFLK